MAYILDSSLAASWCFPDEETSYTRAALRALEPAGALVPRLWAYEIRNTILVGVRRRRIGAVHAADFIGTLETLPIRVRDAVSYLSIYALAERHRLTSHDAAHLDLATRERLPLGTLDAQLARAATQEGVELFRP